MEERTQISIQKETRDKLKRMKMVTLSENYDEALEKLIESSDYVVPESEEEVKELFSERVNA